MSRIIVLGEALIDLFADAGASLRTAKAFQPSPGGAPANVAVALGKLGVDVGFIGKVGDDELGLWLKDVMSGYDVDTTYTTLDSRAPTMLAVVALPKPDSPQFVLYNGANELLESHDIPADYIQNSSAFVYGSVTLSTKSSDAVMVAVDIANQAQIDVIFDVNLRANLWSDLDTARAKIEASIASANIVKANAEEIEFVTGSNDIETGSQAILDRGAQLCCVTLGEDGAYFRNDLASGYVPAFKLNSVDATGSGDAFVAGLAMSIMQRTKPINTFTFDGLFEVIRFANACGALTTTMIGAMSGSPTLAMVNELLDEDE